VEAAYQRAHSEAEDAHRAERISDNVKAARAALCDVDPLTDSSNRTTSHDVSSYEVHCQSKISGGVCYGVSGSAWNCQVSKTVFNILAGKDDVRTAARRAKADPADTENCLRPNAPSTPACRAKIARLVRATQALGEAERLVLREERIADRAERTANVVGTAENLFGLRKAHRSFELLNSAMIDLGQDASLGVLGIRSIPFCGLAACTIVGTMLDPTDTVSGHTETIQIYEQAQQNYLEALQDADPESYSRMVSARQRRATSFPLDGPNCSQGCVKSAR
jgi:hypothetical protein